MFARMKNKNLTQIGILLFLFTFLNCGSNNSGNNSNDSGTCETLASDVTVDPASDACTTTSGKWTQWTVDVEAKTAFKQCNIEEADLYADQEAFDAAEGTSILEGITVTSNDDYVLTSECASGSIEYQNPPTDTTFLFIWEKQ
jgi:hypothetical protein